MQTIKYVKYRRAVGSSLSVFKFSTELHSIDWVKAEFVIMLKYRDGEGGDERMGRDVCAHN